MNSEAEGEAVVTSVGIEAGRGRIPLQREIGRSEVKKDVYSEAVGEGEACS